MKIKTMLNMTARKGRGLAASALVGAMVAGAGLSASVAHAADDYPNKPISYLLHVSPGGGTDVLARLLANDMEEILGQPVVVENRPGGQMGVQLALIVNAQPDGYTIGSTTGSHVAVMNAVFDEYDIDSVDWLVNIVTDAPVLVAHSSVPFDTLDELVAEVKANPGQYSVGGTVDGSVGHVAWAMFAESAGITDAEVPYVPYDSQGDSVTANVGNHVPIGVAWAGITRDHVEAGNLKVLAVVGEERMDVFPDAPTFQEAGYDVDPSWQQFRGIIGPKGVPDDIKQKLYEAVRQSMATQEMQKFVEDSGLTLNVMNHERFTDFVTRQNELTREWIQRLGLDN